MPTTARCCNLAGDGLRRTNIDSGMGGVKIVRGIRADPGALKYFKAPWHPRSRIQDCSRTFLGILDS